MNERSMRVWLVLVVLVVVSMLAALWATSNRLPFGRRAPPPELIPGDIEFYYAAETVVSTINVTLLVFLLLTYADIYIKTRSEFTIGLMVFSIVLLLNAIASHPFVVLLFGFRSFGLGPFALLPELFTLGALIVLLYLSIRY